MLHSRLEQRGRVPFPAHLNERVYMQEFRKADGLPAHLRRWQPTVDAMLDGVDTDGPIFLMVDQGLVRAGATQRRGGLHIDGHWIPAMRTHGGFGGHGMPSRDPGSHRNPDDDAPKTTVKRIRKPKPVITDEQPDADKPQTHYDVEFAPLHADEGLILASNVTGCRGFIGEFEGIGSGGDCSHVDFRALRSVDFQAGHAYAGNVTMLHESLPVPADSLRTLVRLNVPGWTV